MRKYLLPKEGNFYKANFHSHSTCSDGKQTPEEMKRDYKEKGYSILACSDHDHLRTHNDLTEPDFLMMTAYEISFRTLEDPRSNAFKKIVDINLLAKDPNQTTHIAYHPSTVKGYVNQGKISQEEFENIKYAGTLRDMRCYPANINKAIREANENGFLVTVNHPNWSLVELSEYRMYEGAWALEIYNHGCFIGGGRADGEVQFEDILRSGKKIFAIATDDNHGLMERFGGFTMIKAEKLEYATIIKALEKGNFYASSGPEIHELYYEDGKVYITCSEAEGIFMNGLGRRSKAVWAKEGEAVTQAVFEIDPEAYGYVRFSLIDKHGKKAYTNAYYVDELMENAPNRKVIL